MDICQGAPPTSFQKKSLNMTRPARTDVRVVDVAHQSRAERGAEREGRGASFFRTPD